MVLKNHLLLMMFSLLVVVAPEAFASGDDDSSDIPIISSRELISVFNDHQQEFKELQQMTAHDSRAVGYISESEIRGNISEERKQKYRDLLSKIRPGLVVWMNYDTTLRFIFGKTGLSAVGPGSEKGIEYIAGSTDREGRLVKDIDRVRDTSHVSLQQITPKWFMFYQVDSD